MKKVFLYVFAVFFTCCAAFAGNFDMRSVSQKDINDILEKIYVKVAVTVKIDEKNIKGEVTFKEKGFKGTVTCSDKYRASIAGKIGKQNFTAKILLHNATKNKLLYKVSARGNQEAHSFSLYDANDKLIAEENVNGEFKVRNQDAYDKFERIMEKVVKTCTF